MHDNVYTYKHAHNRGKAHANTKGNGRFSKRRTTPPHLFHQLESVIPLRMHYVVQQYVTMNVNILISEFHCFFWD